MSPAPTTRATVTTFFAIWRRGRVVTNPSGQSKRPPTTITAGVEAAINAWKEVRHSIRARYRLCGSDGTQNRALFFLPFGRIIAGGHPSCCPSAFILYTTTPVLSRHGGLAGETCSERNTTPISSSSSSLIYCSCCKLVNSLLLLTSYARCQEMMSQIKLVI